MNLAHCLWTFLRSDCIRAAHPPRRVEHLCCMPNSFMRSASFILISQELKSVYELSPLAIQSKWIFFPLVSASCKIPSWNASDSCVHRHSKYSDSDIVWVKLEILVLPKAELGYIVSTQGAILYIALKESSLSPNMLTICTWCWNMGVMAAPWRAQKSGDKAPLGFRSGRRFLPITPLQVLLSLLQWASKSPNRALGSTDVNPLSGHHPQTPRGPGDLHCCLVHMQQQQTEPSPPATWNRTEANPLIHREEFQHIDAQPGAHRSWVLFYPRTKMFLRPVAACISTAACYYMTISQISFCP